MSNPPSSADASNPAVCRQPTRLRSVAATAHRTLTVATLLSVAAQFFLTGLGVFSRQRQGTSDGYFGPHMALGLTIGALTFLLAATALLSRAASPVLPISAALFLLAGPIEPLLATLGDTDSAWFGALHALTGVIIAALTGTLFARGRRRNTS